MPLRILFFFISPTQAHTHRIEIRPALKFALPVWERGQRRDNQERAPDAVLLVEFGAIGHLQYVVVRDIYKETDKNRERLVSEKKKKKQK